MTNVVPFIERWIGPFWLVLWIVWWLSPPSPPNAASSEMQTQLRT